MVMALNASPDGLFSTLRRKMNHNVATDFMQLLIFAGVFAFCFLPVP
jgi:hypothetical protein